MKRAIIKIAGDILGETANLLRDHGLQIAGSITSPQGEPGTVCLIVEDIVGNKLPDECTETSWWLITVDVRVESYGNQKLMRITKIGLDRELKFGPSLVAA